MNYIQDIYLDMLVDMEMMDRNGEKFVVIPVKKNHIRLNAKHTTLKVYCKESESAKIYNSTHCVRCWYSKDEYNSDEYINKNIVGNMRPFKIPLAKFDKSIYVKKDLSSLDESLNK